MSHDSIPHSRSIFVVSHALGLQVSPAYRLTLQAIVVPFVGVAGNMWDRIYLITAGALIWASMSVAFGFATSYDQARPRPCRPPLHLFNLVTAHSVVWDDVLDRERSYLHS
jgi:hypothetical protein